MWVLRFLVPPVAGASFSLGLFYLYQEAFLVHHAKVKASLESSAPGWDDVKRGINLRMHYPSSPSSSGSSSSSSCCCYSSQANTDARQPSWQQQRNHTLSEEMKFRWNNHLVAFTNGLANVRWDSLKDGIILSTKFLLGDAGSAVSTGARDVASAAQGCGVGGSNDSSSSTGTAVAIGNEFGAVSGGISEFKGIVDTRGVSLRPPEKERSLKSPEGIQQVSLR